MATLKPVFLPKAEDSNQRINDLIKAIELLVTNIKVITEERNAEYDSLDERITDLGG